MTVEGWEEASGRACREMTQETGSSDARASMMSWVLSRRWLECEGGVISGLFHKP